VGTRVVHALFFATRSVLHALGFLLRALMHDLQFFERIDDENPKSNRGACSEMPIALNCGNPQEGTLCAHSWERKSSAIYAAFFVFLLTITPGNCTTSSGAWPFWP